MKKVFKFIAWVFFYMVVLFIAAVIGEEVVGRNGGAFAGPVVGSLIGFHTLYLYGNTWRKK